MRKHFPLIFLLVFIGNYLNGQVSGDCVSAVPICTNTPINGGAVGFGVDDFNGDTRTGCIESPANQTIESNSAWYRFRTGASGQLGFNIGHNSEEDWDFALYLADGCSDLGEPVRCNFFDNRDGSQFIGVGEDPTGVEDSVQYEEFLNVEPNQNYLLFINNFSSSNSGFSIQFTGDIFTTNPDTALDCSIISNLLGSPIAACDNAPVTLDASTPGATSYSWFMDAGNGFQPIVGETNATLDITVDALYRVQVITTSETIVSDVQVAFSFAPTAFAVEDEIFCETDEETFDLSQKNREALGSQNPESYMVSYHNSLADAEM